MTKIDQFESAFKSAAKTAYQPSPVEIKRILSITDLEGSAAKAFEAGLRGFLSALGNDVEFQTATRDQTHAVDDMLARVENFTPDLICSYRNLHTRAWRWKHSLGDRLDILTQAVAVPTLVLPHPDEHGAFAEGTDGTRSVSVLTDHLTGDSRLVDHGVRFTAPGGRLMLTHVEDVAVFERYIELISKIPEIDTDTARVEILDQLLKEPRDYIASCSAALQQAGARLDVVPVVRLGHTLVEHVKLVREEGVDLMVINTKDEDQSAMHGLAYPLAIELRHIPIVML